MSEVLLPGDQQLRDSFAAWAIGFDLTERNVSSARRHDFLRLLGICEAFEFHRDNLLLGLASIYAGASGC